MSRITLGVAIFDCSFQMELSGEYRVKSGKFHAGGRFERFGKAQAVDVQPNQNRAPAGRKIAAIGKPRPFLKVFPEKKFGTKFDRVRVRVCVATSGIP
jgi:hypothetical protein